MADETIENVKMEFQTHIEEYKMLRAEILQRHDSMDKSINYAIILLAAIITAGFLPLLIKHRDILEYTLLLAPIPCYGLEYNYLINNYFIIKIDIYIYRELIPKITKLIDTPFQISLLGFQEYSINEWYEKVLNNPILLFFFKYWVFILPSLFLIAYVIFSRDSISIHNSINVPQSLLILLNIVFVTVTLIANKKVVNAIEVIKTLRKN